MKRINSKIFKILLIATLIPNYFFQVACHQKNAKSVGEEDAKIKKNDEFEKEINLLKIKINDLEEIRANLDKQLEPFKNLMREHNVDNFNDLIKKLFAIDDFELLEKSLIFASCLLETETMTWSKLSEKFDNVQWKNENKEILNDLLPVLGLKSINDLTSHLIIDNKIMTLAEQISKINDSNFIKNMKAKIKEDREKIKKITNELISCYFAQLTDEKYTDWDNFVKQFNNPTWKNNDENKSTIENLIGLLNCTIDDLDENKINNLDSETITSIKGFIDIYQKPIKRLKGRINELEGKRLTLKEGNKDYDKVKNELIVCYLAQLQLCDRNYTGWNSFVKQFDDQNWKDSKNIKKNSLISYYLLQLWDKNYTNWDNFVKQFNNPTWKNDAKNQPTIKNLVTLLNCSIDDLNADKINNIDEIIKKDVENLNDFKKEKGEYKLMERINKQKNDSNRYVIIIPIIRKLAELLDCSIDELNSNKINNLGKEIIDKTEELINKNQQNLNSVIQIVSEQFIKNIADLENDQSALLAKLESAESQNNIFRNLLKKYGVENITELKNKIDTVISKIKHIDNFFIFTKNVIDVLNILKKNNVAIVNTSYEDLQREFLSKSYEDFDTKIKDSLIIYSLCQLKEKPIDTEYTWEDFAQKFDNNSWKNKHSHCIDILSRVLGINFNEINKESVNKILSKEIKDAVNDCPYNDITLPESPYTNYLNSFLFQATSYAFAKVWAISIDNWETFIQRFNSSDWRDRHQDVVYLSRLKQISDVDYIPIQIRTKVDEIIEEQMKRKKELKITDKMQKMRKDIWDSLILVSSFDIKNLIVKINYYCDALKLCCNENFLKESENIGMELAKDLNSFS